MVTSFPGRRRLTAAAAPGKRATMVRALAWVNDRDTLRKAGAASDPYAMFARMLAHGDPPDDWPRLLAAAQDPAAMRRFATVAPKP